MDSSENYMWNLWIYVAFLQTPSPIVHFDLSRKINKKTFPLSVGHNFCTAPYLSI